MMQGHDESCPQVLEEKKEEQIPASAGMTQKYGNNRSRGLIYQARKKNYRNNWGRINSTPTTNNTKEILSFKFLFWLFAFN